MVRRPCWVEISTHAFEDNYKLLAQACRARVSSALELLAIVKADAYGHGLSICAPAAVRAGAGWIGVTSVEEGVAARQTLRGLEPAPEILTIGGVFPGQGAEVIAHRLTPVIWEPYHLDELEAAAKATDALPGSIPVHVELDTGMSRQGVELSELGALLERFRKKDESPVRIDGIMTHLYAADERDGEATHHQLDRLENMLEQVAAAGLKPRWLHVGNSAAVLLGGAPETALASLVAIAKRHGMHAMARPGLALYGLVPEFDPPLVREELPLLDDLHKELQPALAWKTQIASVRSIGKDEVVGYNGTFVATEPMHLALLPIGYADGLKRALSNRGYVLIQGERAPIVGRISMDQTVVDVTDIPKASPGDEVVLLGPQGDETISACDHANWAETIPWEIFTSITARVERRAV
ncbi:alanine racemase [Acidicapsa dinghuensis]|uniref:Alanine racemase n=1 Tax=Acidicapsa dinghuensis TaxID=2218256 RepID=A0ABW1EJU3_9BACT|nr:alanine racemase [Acidicapsa dinghuensis]